MASSDSPVCAAPPAGSQALYTHRPTGHQACDPRKHERKAASRVRHFASPAMGPERPPCSLNRPRPPGSASGRPRPHPQGPHRPAVGSGSRQRRREGPWPPSTGRCALWRGRSVSCFLLARREDRAAGLPLARHGPSQPMCLVPWPVDGVHLGSPARGGLALRSQRTGQSFLPVAPGSGRHPAVHARDSAQGTSATGRGARCPGHGLLCSLPGGEAGREDPAGLPLSSSLVPSVL